MKKLILFLIIVGLNNFTFGQETTRKIINNNIQTPKISNVGALIDTTNHLSDIFELSLKGILSIQVSTAGKKNQKIKQKQLTELNWDGDEDESNTQIQERR